MNIEIGILIKRFTTLALVTGFNVFRNIFAVNNFSQNSRTSCFTHSAWATKQKCLSQLIVADCILKCLCYLLLSNNIFEPCRSVFTRRYNEILHPETNITELLIAECIVEKFRQNSIHRPIQKLNERRQLIKNRNRFF